MAAARGGADVRRFMAQLPDKIERKLLRGAAREMGDVVLAEAKERVTSDEVRAALVAKVKSLPGRVVVTVTVPRGWARSVGIWLEYGTAPHFITVDDRQRAGMSINRINKRAADGSLMIGGKFVGKTVHHPGAKAHPFLRVALDLKEADAIAAAQSFIRSRVGPAGITGDDEPESEAA